MQAQRDTANIENIIIEDSIFAFIKETWKFQNQQKTQKAIIFIKKLKKSYCEEIKANLHKGQQINYLLKSINLPQFPKLKIINLKGCSITSIEPISFINAPLLIMICLQKNKISITKSMQKWYFSQLRYINLKMNLAQQSEYYSRMFLNTVTEKYFDSFKNFKKENSTNLKDIQPEYLLTNIYNFNTKIRRPQHQKSQQKRILLGSLFVEDPRFLAKLQISSHLINHVQIRQDGKVLKFDSKNRKLPCPFKDQNQKKQRQFNKFECFNFSKNEQPKNQVKTQQNIQNEKSMKKIEQLKKQENKNTIPGNEIQFRYLDIEQKRKLSKFLIFHPLHQLQSYVINDIDLRFQCPPNQISNIRFYRKLQNLKRIQQAKAIKTLKKKFTVKIFTSQNE